MRQIKPERETPANVPLCTGPTRETLTSNMTAIARVCLPTTWGCCLDAGLKFYDPPQAWYRASLRASAQQ